MLGAPAESQLVEWRPLQRGGEHRKGWRENEAHYENDEDCSNL